MKRTERKFKPLGRSVSKRIPKRKIVIYSEGEKTEPDYFEAVRKHIKDLLIDIDIVDGAGVPLTIAKEASKAAREFRRINRKQSYAESDEFWAVFDRDEHPNISDAIQLCESTNVGVALSDPCFEVWLILHFQEFDRPDDRHQVQRHLETICTDYNRNRRKTTDCDKLIAQMEKAEERAEVQLKRRNSEGNTPSRPFTTVFQLTRRIRGIL
jgi:hypothetical protein